MPSLLPNVQVPRKPTTKRNYEHHLLDETNKFLKQDIIKSIDDLNDSSSPCGYHYNKINDKIMFMKFTYANDDGAPSLKCIMVDENLHVNLSNQGNTISLSDWFQKSLCKLK